MIWIIDLEI